MSVRLRVFAPSAQLYYYLVDPSHSFEKIDSKKEAKMEPGPTPVPVTSRTRELANRPALAMEQ